MSGIVSRPSSKEYRSNYDEVFKKDKNTDDSQSSEEEQPKKSEKETSSEDSEKGHYEWPYGC